MEGRVAHARERNGPLMLAGAVACLVLLPGVWLCVRCALPGPGRSSFSDVFTRAADAYSLVLQDLPHGKTEDGHKASDEDGDFWRWSRASAGLPEPKSDSRDRPRERGARPPGSRTLTRHVQPRRGDVDHFDDTVSDMEADRPSMPVPKHPVGVGHLAELWGLFGGEEHDGAAGGDAGAQATSGWLLGN